VEFRYTEDGTPTLFHPGYGEAYHPRQGALLQARRLYLEKTRTHLHPAPRVLEVGLGLMVNFRVALECALARGVFLRYLAVEKEPLPREVMAAIRLPLPLGERVFGEILKAWPEERFTGPWGELKVVFGDIREAALPTLWATAVYLDPFSPQKNPEAWEKALLVEASSGQPTGGGPRHLLGPGGLQAGPEGGGVSPPPGAGGGEAGVDGGNRRRSSSVSM
jgi:tRNA U34 5-methylaminomethyl-2-thiouridine-forming methyltransferase MnmC